MALERKDNIMVEPVDEEKVDYSILENLHKLSWTWYYLLEGNKEFLNVLECIKLEIAREKRKGKVDLGGKVANLKKM